jgi:hypothetical protein
MFMDPSYVEHVAVNTPESDTSIRVFDLENKGWRSFRWDSVKEVRFTL